mmetsp:Transcript_4325/g.5130  ORF Transcript_4325/g.5130 Transcript_4325/m.5130 type:complete len:156 (+) Transcript_4325:68-535(+)
MSSHCVMTMLVALLLAFGAGTFAEETNMNVSGKQMVQELTKGNMSIGRNHSVATSNDPMSQSKASLRGTVNPSSNRNDSAAGGEVVVAAVVAQYLWKDWAYGNITGSTQCASVINFILDTYDHCLPTCAKTVARNIAKLACRSYCKCSKEKPKWL